MTGISSFPTGGTAGRLRNTLISWSQYREYKILTEYNN